MIGLDVDRLPTGWTLSPLDSVAEVVISNVDKNDYADQHRVKLCNYTDVYYRSEILDREDYMFSTASQEQIERFTVQRGDVAITKDSETSDDIGRPSYAPDNIPGLVYGYHLAIYRPFDKRFGRFIRYLFDSLPVRAELQARTPGVTRVGLSMDTLRNLRVPLPAPDLATRIAEYLDHETAEIDTFIRDQTTLLELLEEKTSSQITVATSRGLGAHEPFNNRWYPRLGAGWRTSHLKSVSVKLTDGAHISPVTENGTYPFVSTKDVKRGEIDTRDCLRTNASTAEYMIRTGCKPESGDVLFSKDGTVGESAIVGSDAGFVVASSLVIIRPSSRIISSPFLRMTLLSHPVREQARAFMKGAGLPRISVANVGRLTVPVPGMDEQRKIVAYLSEHVRQADELREDITRLITLARERRAALITAAVTGQLDVTARNKPAAEQLEDDIAHERYGREGEH